jgi:hypothetical protein
MGERIASVAAIKLELEPVYLRISQASYVYGISRTRLFALIAEGKIKSRYLIQPGNSRGIRLLEEKSLRQYVESFDSEGRRTRKEVEV